MYMYCTQFLDPTSRNSMRFRYIGLRSTYLSRAVTKGQYGLCAVNQKIRLNTVQMTRKHMAIGTYMCNTESGINDYHKLA